MDSVVIDEVLGKLPTNQLNQTLDVSSLPPSSRCCRMSVCAGWSRSRCGASWPVRLRSSRRWPGKRGAHRKLHLGRSQAHLPLS